MKTSHQKPQPRKGIALITVLLVLSLLVILTIAILSTAMREMGGASLQDRSVRAKSLADTVTSIAIAKIKSATRPPEGSEAFTWSSQPGMIVTYDENGFRRGHKLYSSSKSIIDRPEDLLADSQRLARWSSSPESFVDLNAADIRYGTGETVESVSFPILDPRAQWIDRVEGFTIDLANTPGGNSEEVAAGLALPMPVEWVYLLEDGSIGTLAASGKYSGSGSPTRDNSIIARFGYWIDDETSKVNINVASEAAPWDVPRTASTAALKRGERQPAFNELYRYAGHPATTCLSSIFFPGAYADDDSRSAPDTRTLALTELQSIYELAPKTAFGGSRAGTQVVDTAVTLDNDRLYPSIDELIFRVTRGEQSVFTGSNIDTGKLARTRGFLTARSRAPEVNIHGAPRIAMWPVDEDTTVGAHRSAYDATMDFCSTLESGSGDQHFIVRREAPEETTAELYSTAEQGNAKLLHYLLAQTNQSLPNSGRTLAQKYGSPGGSAAKLPTTRPGIPGISEDPFASVTSDYYRDHTRIALQMLDYIRGVNLHDASVTEPYADPFRATADGSPNTFGQVAPWIFSSPDLSSEEPSKLAWHEYEKFPFPKGYGRHYSLSEVALVIFCSAEGRLRTSGTPIDTSGNRDPYNVFRNPEANHPVFENLTGNGRDRFQLYNHPLAYMKENEGRWLRYLQVGILPEIFAPMQGFHQIHPKLALRMVTNAEEGYKGAWGNPAPGEYHDQSTERTATNLPGNNPRNAYPSYTGYTITDDITGFKNPISYWGNFSTTGSNAKTNDPLGPILQTIDLGKRQPDEFRGDLPSGWFGWGGSGGYRIMRFGRERVDDHNYFTDASTSRTYKGISGVGHTELTNGTSGIAPFYAQKPIVVTADRRSSRVRSQATHTFTLNPGAGPIQFLLHDELDNDIQRPDDSLLQVIEVAFPTVPEISVPNLPAGSDWHGWGRRLNRAARNEAARTQPLRTSRVDMLNDTDVVISVIPRHGDFRHIAGRSFVPSELWKIHPKADALLVGGQLAPEDARLGLKAHSLMHSNPVGSAEKPADRPAGEVSEGITGALGATFLDDYSEPRRSLTFADYGADPDTGYQPDFTFDPDSPTFLPTAMLENRRGIDTITYDPARTRDFDNGVGNARDGAYTNKPDDGADPLRKEERGFGNIPYFNVDKAAEFDYRSRFDKGQVDNTFSPNQMVPSPVMFGSLPNAMQANIPWSTLLFRPDLQDEDSPRRHLGNAGIGLDQDFNIIKDEALPADHLWLDLFWMPVVDPFPISEPLSTMGKVNMNYQILPFTYIERATAMHAVLKGERILAVPEEDSTTYKRAGASGGDHYHKIDAEKTLKQFETKFAKGETFVTASEITEHFLYPAGEETPDFEESGDTIREWWAAHPQTGDNSLERPYANLYSKLTTQSNTFTVHSTVQVLEKARSTAPDTWVEGKDQVVATYRSSALIERYIDPERNDFPEFLGFDVDAEEMPRLENLYAYRILNTKEFAP